MSEEWRERGREGQRKRAGKMGKAKAERISTKLSENLFTADTER